ncbi:MAG: nucleoside monophosphate kinase [bacterium]
MTKSKTDIILYGGPASGKGTQAELLVKKLQAATLSMGAELRRLAAAKTLTGQRVKRYVDAGQIVPPEISDRIVRRFVAQVPAARVIVFDGFPRTIAQARTLDKILARRHRQAKTIFIKLPIAVAKARLAKRAAIEHRQDDASPGVIARRIRIFNDRAKQVLQYYRQTKRLGVADGNATISAVHRRIIKLV